jgi:hypothetical protein
LIADSLQKERKIGWQIAILWLVLNLLQAAFTPLTEDEAYYWMYSTSLDWGYFDHPPMVAVFIWLGGWMGGELGVRLVAVFAQVVALLLIWRLVRIQWPGPHQAKVFFGIAFSILIFQAFGFISTPDAPLLLFSALFLYVFHKFLGTQNFPNALLLGLCAAALLYSKYHGALLIGLAVLANPGLLRKPYLYMAGFFALLVFSPHLYWQFKHNFPSFRYHLVDRNQEFKAWYVFEFITNLVLVFNPLLWPPLIRAVLKSDWKEPFSRTLLVVLGGFLIFFLISTTRGHVQPQWLVVCTLPILILSYNYVFSNPRASRYVLRLVGWVIPLSLIVRLIMATEWTPMPNQFFHPREFAVKVKEIAHGRGVAFTRSYQRASLYGFYADSDQVFSAGTYKSRRSQFDIWKKEEAMHLQPIVWLGGQTSPREKFLIQNHDTISYLEIDTFHAIYKIQPQALQLPTKLYHGTPVNVTLQLENPYPFRHDLAKIKGIQIVACWMKGKKPAGFASLSGELPHLNPGEKKILQFSFLPPNFLKGGAYRLGFAFKYYDIQPFPAGNWQLVTLENKPQ